MHYANGREAKNGDKIVLVNPYSVPGVFTGVLIDATAGNDYCNGTLIPFQQVSACPNLKECLHIDDVKAILADPSSVPDVSKPATPTSEFPIEAPDGTIAT